MSRLHDMGGRYGDGPIVPDAPDAPVFAQEWQARALALTLACGSLGLWNIDISRHARERLAPHDYARFSYYEKWVSALADLLVAHEVLECADLSGRQCSGNSPLARRALKAGAVAQVLASGAPTDRTGPAPRFVVGDRVHTRRRARNAYVDGGHTRLPAYAAGVPGRIVRVHGCHVLPDRSAHRSGDAQEGEPLYCVAFAAGALWGDVAHPKDEVMLDLWESYLHAA